MLQPRLRQAYLPALIFAAAGCAEDIGELEDAPSATDIANSVVVAQFDPSNAIPQLRVLPSPTQLAQLPDGSINKPAVRPAACELPDPAQCLELVEGAWPTTLLPTLNFSARLVEASAAEGLRLYEVGTDGTLTRIPVTLRQVDRNLPPEACQTGNNGTNPPRTFTQDDVIAAWGPTPTDVILVPQGGLQPSRRYLVVGTRALQGAPAVGDQPRVVEPSSLFYILNREGELLYEDTVYGDPVQRIANPLLRAQVETPVLAAAFGGRSFASLEASERQQVAMLLQPTYASLGGLKQLVDSTTGLLLRAGEIQSRDEVVIVNTWTTGTNRAPTVVTFDPAGSTFPTDIRFPLPNDQLLTVPSSSVAGGLQVAFPTANLTGSLRSVVEGLNTLNGFGLTTPIIMQTSRRLDPATLEGNVVMVELDAMGRPTSNRPAIRAVSTASTADTPPQLIIQPIVPLAPNTRYVVGVSTAVRDVQGQPIRAASTYDLLKSPNPIIQGGQVDPAIEPILQCATLGANGMFDLARVPALATSLEVGLARPRWQVAFQALEMLTPPLPRTQVAMAFTYKTQSITDTLDQLRSALPLYEGLPPMNGRLLPPVLEWVGSAAIAQGADLVGRLCIAACQTGALEPAIPRAECAMRRAEVAATQACQLVVGAYTSNLGRARLLPMRQYRVTSGTPYVTGTFTPATAQMPDVEYATIWLFTPTGNPPASGWPVAVVQHGLGGDKSAGLLVANTLATAGWATVAMDMPFHGDRASDLVNGTGTPCPAIDPGNVTCDPTTLACMNGCDGRRDPSGTGFLSANVFAVRDNFRQATLDHLTLLRTIEQEAMTGRGLDGLDPSRVGYIGTSLGGIAGANLAAYTTPMDLQGVVLSVAGAGLVDILTNTVPTISAGLYAGLAAAGVCQLRDPANPGAGCQDTPLFRTFLILAQWVLEPGDPIATSVGVVGQLPMREMNFGSSRILLQVSRPDPVIVNRSSETLGRVFGFDLMQGDRRYQVYDFSTLPAATVGGGCHGFTAAPVCGRCFQDALCNTFGAQVQAATFLGSSGMTVAPQRPGNLLGLIDCNNPCPAN